MASNENDAGILLQERKKWSKGRTILVALAGFFAVRAAFQQSVVKDPLVGDLVLFAMLLLLSWTFPGKWHRFLAAISLLITLSTAFGIEIYDYVSHLDTSGNRLYDFFLGGQTEKIVFSGLIGSSIGLSVIGAPLFILLLTSSEYVLALHEFAGVTRWDALRWLWSLVMGIQLPWQIVEDERITVTKPSGVFGEIGGPGVVVVRPGSAVAFELGGELTRIEGPGVYKTKRFERIKQVVDLRPQWATVSAENVLTKDRVPLKLEVGVGYQIEPKQDTDRRIEEAESQGKEFKWEYERGGEVIEGVYPVYKDSVFRAVYRVSRAGWQVIMQAIPDSFLRDVVITHTLDQLYEPSEAEEGQLSESPRILADIEGKVKERLEKAATNFGVRIGIFDIKSVTMPKEVRGRILEWWEAEWKRRTAIKEAKGERQAIMEKAMGRAWALERLEEVKADARQAMIRQLVNAISRIESERPQTTIRFIHVIEQLSRRMMTDDIIATHYCEVLEAIAHSGGQKVFILGQDRQLLERGEDALRGLLDTGILRTLDAPGVSIPGSPESRPRDDTGGRDVQSSPDGLQERGLPIALGEEGAE